MSAWGDDGGTAREVVGGSGSTHWGHAERRDASWLRRWPHGWRGQVKQMRFFITGLVALGLVANSIPLAVQAQTERIQKPPSSKPPKQSPSRERPTKPSPPRDKPVNPPVPPRTRLPEKLPRVCPPWSNRDCTGTSSLTTADTSWLAASWPVESVQVTVTALGAGEASGTGPCRPGYDLVDEDDNYWYCEKRATDSDFGSLQRILDRYGPDPRMVGREWRFRKALIDVMGCLAHNPAVYAWGARPHLPTPCDRVFATDCSGATSYANDVAACFVGGVQAAAQIGIPGLRTTANGQANYYKRNGAWIPREGSPQPGDLMFFITGQSVPPVVDHVGVYVGTSSDGWPIMIHAENRGHRVIFTRMDPKGYYSRKLTGYGNASLLMLTVGH